MSTERDRLERWQLERFQYGETQLGLRVVWNGGLGGALLAEIGCALRESSASECLELAVRWEVSKIEYGESRRRRRIKGTRLGLSGTHSPLTPKKVKVRCEMVVHRCLKIDG